MVKSLCVLLSSDFWNVDCVKLIFVVLIMINIDIFPLKQQITTKNKWLSSMSIKPNPWDLMAKLSKQYMHSEPIF